MKYICIKWKFILKNYKVVSSDVIRKGRSKIYLLQKNPYPR